MPIWRETILYFNQILLRPFLDPFFSKNLQFGPKKALVRRLKEFASDDFSNFGHRVSLCKCPSIEIIKKIRFFHLRQNRASKNWALHFLDFSKITGQMVDRAWFDLSTKISLASLAPVLTPRFAILVHSFKSYTWGPKKGVKGHSLTPNHDWLTWLWLNR